MKLLSNETLKEFAQIIHDEQYERWRAEIKKIPNNVTLEIRHQLDLFDDANTKIKGRRTQK